MLDWKFSYRPKIKSTWYWYNVVTVHYSDCIQKFIKIKPAHDKTNKMTCKSSEDSDQPGNLPVWSVFAVRFMGS